MRCRNKRKPALAAAGFLSGVEDQQMTPDYIPTGRRLHIRVEAAMTADRRFVVTFFSDVDGQDLTEKEMSLDEFAIWSSTPRRDKKSTCRFSSWRISALSELPRTACVSTATSRASPAPKPTTTTRDGFRPRGRAPQSARLKSLVYTSPSYAPSAPKWRVVSPHPRT